MIQTNNTNLFAKIRSERDSSNPFNKAAGAQVLSLGIMEAAAAEVEAEAADGVTAQEGTVKAQFILLLFYFENH